MPRVPFIAAGAVVAAAALGACSGTGAKPTPVSAAAPAAVAGTQVAATRAITATGQGQASGTPDLLTVTIGVQTNGPTARGVLSTNSTEAAALISKLEADGVASKDIQTAQLSLNPVYANPGVNEAPRLTGYAATDTVVAGIKQLDKAGAILDDAVAAGGNDSQIQSVSYSVQDAGALLASAHGDAVRQAEAAAKAMAAAAGVTLGPVRAVTDVMAPQVVPFDTGLRSSAAASAPVAVPVQPGSVQVTAQVTVSYDVG